MVEFLTAKSEVDSVIRCCNIMEGVFNNQSQKLREVKVLGWE
jgi:hypothetical protein